MSILEFILQCFYQLQPVIPVIVVTVVATTLILLIGLIPIKFLWFNKKSMGILGLFFALDNVGSIRLACVWLRMLIGFVCLFSFTTLTAQHYVLIAIPCLACMFTGFSIGNFLGSLFGNLAFMVCMLVTNLLFSYMGDIHGGGIVIKGIYAAMLVFMSLFNYYFFMVDLDGVSERRTFTLNDEEKKVNKALDE